MMHNTWGQKLREVFDGIDDPVWNGDVTATPLLQPSQRVQALKKIQTPDDKLI
jgi:putative proteasome-type protease